MWFSMLIVTFLKGLTMSSEKKEGLELLSDETLTKIVEGDVAQQDDIKSPEAAAAFAELARRSGVEGF